MNDRDLMQEALDALESLQAWPETPENFKRFRAIEALRARLAQPEQEPVAWMYDWYDETEDIDGVPIGGIVHDWISKDYDEAHSPTMGCHNIRPLYTAPPQRKWQGLTDEEVEGLWDSSFYDYVGITALRAIVRAIEAKLKEKNT